MQPTLDRMVQPENNSFRKILLWKNTPATFMDSIQLAFQKQLDQLQWRKRNKFSKDNPS